ncbi:MAG TPA: hypothetical protein VN948_15000 [Terriglobales bacterium]|nr:hypothetical protein [Terriglobales bacterium]
MSNTKDLVKMRDELREACKKLDEKIAELEQEDGGAEKQAHTLIREVALKSGEGRKGTLTGITAIRMLGGRRGGPPSE